MDFKPIIARTPAVMDRRIFLDEPIGLRDDITRLPLEQRFSYDEGQNLFFVNFESLVIRTREDIDKVHAAIEQRLAPLGRKVYGIVNYDNFNIVPELLDEYSEMVRDVRDRFYCGITRYTTSGFLRMKLGEALEKRKVAPHIYESAEEARRHLHDFD
jgi:propionate CoA-transferase